MQDPYAVRLQAIEQATQFIKRNLVQGVLNEKGAYGTVFIAVNMTSNASFAYLIRIQLLR